MVGLRRALVDPGLCAVRVVQGRQMVFSVFDLCNDPDSALLDALIDSVEFPTE
ncbi:MAG: hypothetical protein WBP59_13615 [Ilumatobacteraceae bacterium]